MPFRWDVSHPLELINPQVFLIGHEHGAYLYDHGDHPVRTWTNPLDALEWLASESWSAGAIPHKQAWVGFLSYDLGRLFEKLPSRADDRLRTPLFVFGFSPSPGTPSFAEIARWKGRGEGSDVFH
jgi:hypothetical protein